jgi:4-hydroxybenzoate polyprenyltransferase
LILVPAWSFYALGVHLAPAPARVELFSVVTQPGFWCLSAILASAYVLNQIFDEESDRLNDKGQFLTHGIFRARTLVLIALACFVAASFLFQRVAGAQHGLLVGALLLSFTYSLPPLRWCARPGFDLVANAVGYGGIAFALGSAAVSTRVTPAFVDALPWVLLVGATFLHTTILDVDGDAAAGKRTTTVALGVPRSARLATFLAAGAAALETWLCWRRGGSVGSAVVTVLALAIFVAANARVLRAEKEARRDARAASSAKAVQGVTALVALWAVLRDPVLLFLLLPLAMAARVYYRARFGLRYPG